MARPSIEEYLDNLYRMKRDCLLFIAQADRRGDKKEAAQFRELLQRVESMIEMKGGNSDSLGRDQGLGPHMEALCDI